MSRALARAAGAAALVLAACAPLGPDYARPALELPADYPEPAAGTAALPADWWRAFGDPTLDALVGAARERNADLRVAAAQLEEAEAALREVDAGRYPQVDLSFTNSESRVSALTALPNPQPRIRLERRLAASTAFELDFWGRLRRGVEAARAQALASRYGRDTVALTLAGTVAQAYFALRALDAQIAFTRATLAAREEALALARVRVAGGVAPELEERQAEVARADAAVQRDDLVRQRKVIAHQLAQLTGRAGSEVAAGTFDALPVPPQPPAGLPSALLERRPDVRAAEQALVAANARIGVAKAALFPTISLTGSLGGQSASFADLLLQGARIWSIGFGLALPLFDAGRAEARVEQAEARQRQAVALYQRAAESAFREVADALSNLELARQSEDALKTRRTAARRALELAQARHAAGYSGYLEVLDAQRSANDAELAAIRNRQALLGYSVDLMKALGGGWAPAGSASR
ncbi:MAG: efflux transporter outer membrane subunit [Burkholderiales bacterium]|nr:efflux transporter outer membrane subunit [Burkholderiales bacterium]